MNRPIPLRLPARFTSPRAVPALLAPSLLAVVLAGLLGGCAGERAYREGNALLAQDQAEAGLLKYREALAAEPSNLNYQMTYLRARDGVANRLLAQADRELAEGKGELALQDYSRVLALNPANDRARAGLRDVDAARRHAVLLDEARALAERQDLDGARRKLDTILAERPNNAQARALLAEVNDKAAQAQAEPTLGPAFRAPISLEFRDAPLKQIFEVIARHSNLNFLFDKDVKTDQRTSIFLKNSTVEAAIHYLLMSNQLERQVMDGNTVLIYPNLPAKQKDYQEMQVKTFYLSNADAKSIANTLKTILKSRDVVVDEKLNLVILHDSPEAIRLATQLIALQDVPEAEVMLDVEVLEVQRNRLLDLGVDWPTNVQFSPLTISGTPLTVDQLRHLNGASIGVTGVAAAIRASQTDGDSNTLAAPRIRVRNKEKARVVIGDKLPTITTTISSGVGGFASESVNYVDVGLKLDVEPTIYLNSDVGIRISLEVSNLVDTITTKSGTTAYRIGTRSASTMLQLRDGENQVLAGLIKNEDRSSGTKLPGVGSLPLVGRLFGSNQDSTNKTEVVLSITPHLVRSLQRPPASSSEFSAGTDASFRRRPDTAVRVPVQLPGTPGAVGGVGAAGARALPVQGSMPSTSAPAVSAQAGGVSAPGTAAPALPGSAPAAVTATAPAAVIAAPAGAVVAPAPSSQVPVAPAPSQGGAMVPATSVNIGGALPAAPASVPASALPPTPGVQVTPLPAPSITPLPAVREQ